MSLLDDITSEVQSLSDDELKAMADDLLAKQAAQEAKRNDPVVKERTRERARLRRERQKAIIALAKEKGLVPAD